MEIKPGKYKHFKGGIYEVLGIAKHSENPEEEFVVYTHDNQMWIRPINMFTEEIERDGYKGPRFRYLEN